MVTIARNGATWASKTVEWSRDDIQIVDATPGRDGKVGRKFRMVDGELYGQTESGRWVDMGDATSIDPASGTTPPRSSPR